MEKNSAMHAHIHVIPHKLSKENINNCVELMDAEMISGYDEFFRQEKKGRFDYFIDNNQNFYLNNKHTGKPPFIRLFIGEETGLKYLRTNERNSVVYYENTFETLDIFESFDKDSFFTKQRMRTKKETEKLNEKVQKVLEKVKGIIVEQLGVAENAVTMEASFIDDLGADSLDIVELVMALEEEFDIEIPDSDAEKVVTVEDVVEYIKENVK